MSEEKKTSYLWNILSNVFSLFYKDALPEQNNSIVLDDSKLLEGWEWVLSNAETNFNAQQERQKAKMQKEIRKLRRIGQNVKCRPYILNRVRDFYSSLPDKYRGVLLSSRLEGSLRNSIIQDLIKDESSNIYTLISQIVRSHFLRNQLINVLSAVKGEEKSEIVSVALLRNFCTDNDLYGRVPADRCKSLLYDLSNRWKRETYLLNVCGKSADFCFMSSSKSESEGLTADICGEILWTLSLSLCRELTSLLERSLFHHENLMICDYIFSVAKRLTDLWHDTTLNTGNVANRLGRFNIIKEDLTPKVIAASFNLGCDPLIRSSFKNNNDVRVELISKDDFKNRSSLLFDKLVKRDISIHPFNEVLITHEDFVNKSANLQCILKFRSFGD